MMDSGIFATGVEAGTFVVAALGLFLVYIQHQWNKRRSRFENTMRLIDRLESVEMLHLRHEIESLAIDHGGAISYKKIENEPDKERRTHLKAACSIVPKLFGVVAFMCQREEANQKIIVEGWARHIIANYERLSDYLIERDALEGGVGFLNEFEWLYKKAKAYAARHKPKTRQSPPANPVLSFFGQFGGRRRMTDRSLASKEGVF